MKTHPILTPGKGLYGAGLPKPVEKSKRVVSSQRDRISKRRKVLMPQAATMTAEGYRSPYEYVSTVGIKEPKIYQVLSDYNERLGQSINRVGLHAMVDPIHITTNDCGLILSREAFNPEEVLKDLLIRVAADLTINKDTHDMFIDMIYLCIQRCNPYELGDRVLILTGAQRWVIVNSFYNRTTKTEHFPGFSYELKEEGLLENPNTKAMLVGVRQIKELLADPV